MENRSIFTWPFNTAASKCYSFPVCYSDGIQKQKQKDQNKRNTVWEGAPDPSLTMHHSGIPIVNFNMYFLLDSIQGKTSEGQPLLLSQSKRKRLE